MRIEIYWRATIQVGVFALTNSKGGGGGGEEDPFPTLNEALRTPHDTKHSCVGVYNFFSGASLL